MGQVAEHARREDVLIELRAQIERAKQLGIPVTHLDTHMGALVSRADLVEVYVQVGLEYDLPILFMNRFDQGDMAAFPVLREVGPRFAKTLEEAALPRLDHLIQFYDGEGHDERMRRYVEAIDKLPPGITELIIHCGHDDPELRAITSSAARRDSDRRVFTDPAMAQRLAARGIELTTWKKLRAADVK